jgi:phospholipase D1/2
MSATGSLVHSFTAHFVQRWNFVKKNKYRDNPRYARLPPYPEDTSSSGDTAAALGRRFADALRLNQPQVSENTGTTFAQLCRSVTKWSQGVEHEKSIQNAYIDLIAHATCTILANPTNRRLYLH